MQRPAGVTILAVLNYLVGAYLFVGSMFGLMALWLGPFAVVFWGVNALFFGLGYGLWKLRDWARWTQIVLCMIGAVGWLLLTISVLRDGFDSETLFLGFGFTALNVVIILCLLRPQVKQAFGASSHSGGNPEVQKASEP
jgi:ABC-type uncharacterized transport system permease subunit